MDEFRQSDEQTAAIEAYEAELAMKNHRFKARCIQWDKTDDEGNPVEADLPAEVEVGLEDLGLPPTATMTEVEDELMTYLADYYGFCHFGFFVEEVENSL